MLNGITIIEGLILILMASLFVLIFVVQFRRRLRHRFWLLGLFFPLVRYRLFMDVRRSLRLEYRDILVDGRVRGWTNVQLRLPRNVFTWLWNPELLVKGPVFEFANYLTRYSGSKTPPDSKVQLAVDVLGKFILQQSGSADSVGREWRVVLAEAARESTLFQSKRLRTGGSK